LASTQVSCHLDQGKIGGEHTMRKPDTPFARHWLYYIVLKYVLIALAILLTLYVAYQYV
jgi:hypothetical protein